jgi:hypothetical protein
MRKIALDSAGPGFTMPSIPPQAGLKFRRDASGKKLPPWQTPQVIPVYGDTGQHAKLITGLHL